MRQRRRHDDNENHEAWAIPYGDLVTLLLAFFVVMYAMSTVNEGKYRVLSDSLNEAFNGPPRTALPIEVGGAQGQSIDQLPLTQVNHLITASLPIRHAMPASNANPAPSAPAGQGEGASGGELNQVADQVSRALSSLIATGNVHVRRYESWVAVDISTDILFGSGVARLSDQAVGVLQRLADTLKPFPNELRVQGHTDDRPINTAAFPSNWELSAARAASVVHLFMDRGIEPRRLAVVGYGEFRPAMPNDTVAGRNANRRVEVLIFNADTGAEGHP